MAWDSKRRAAGDGGEGLGAGALGGIRTVTKKAAPRKPSARTLAPDLNPTRTCEKDALSARGVQEATKTRRALQMYGGVSYEEAKGVPLVQ